MTRFIIGKKIRKLRLAQDKSQGEIATLIGISTPAFSKIETGVTDLNISRLTQISELFEVPVISFFIDEDGPEEVSLRKELKEMKEKMEILKDKLICCLEGKC